MIIFIDGYQNTGKTTLIKNCKYKHGRFPFNQYLELFKGAMDINGYQLTKDLGICFMSQFVKDNIILDRGPLSTIFYSLKENRYGHATPAVMTKFVSALKEYKNCRYVFVKKINDKTQEKRIHNDGFDYLDDDNDEKKDELLNQMVVASEIAGLKIYIFENDFSLSLKQNFHRFNDFLEGIINEHDRD